ncbi:MAG: recombinase family protein [Lachnospiraceae bacterium]|nr:recombinase family protein [Lachnospiraceae bacterium]
MVYGYCRVSTNMQAKDGNSLEVQEKLLKENGAEEIYSDAFTGTKAHRPELDKLLDKLQQGDKLVITKLDRIARSAAQGTELIQTLLDNGITVHVLNMGLMDNTPTGKLIRNIMLAFAEFERDMIVERTQEGKAIAKKQPGFREGRPRLYGKKQIQHALSLLHDHSYRQVTELTGISKSTLIRAKNKAAQNQPVTKYQ